MAKPYEEVASEIIQELVKARGQVIAGVDQISTQKELLVKYLSDEAITQTYDKIIKQLVQSAKNP